MSTQPILIHSTAMLVCGSCAPTDTSSTTGGASWKKEYIYISFYFTPKNMTLNSNNYIHAKMKVNTCLCDNYDMAHQHSVCEGHSSLLQLAAFPQHTQNSQVLS